MRIPSSHCGGGFQADPAGLTFIRLVAIHDLQVDRPFLGGSGEQVKVLRGSIALRSDVEGA